MFNNSVVDFPWRSLLPTGSHWKLLKFDSHSPPSWREFELDQREYWKADAPDQRRFQMYFGEKNTEENFQKKTRIQYEDYVEYLKSWQGLCAVNEKIQVILLEPHVIALSKNWQGGISDHSDLELWLKEEITWYRKHVRYCCEGYTFGTIFVPHGGIEEQLGEAPGSSRVAHKWGPDKTVTFNNNRKEISIADAIFSIEL